MLISLLILIISICVRFLFKRLALAWDWLSPASIISGYLMLACAVLFVLMSVITIVKAIKK